jgi:hypothetical protein
MWLVQGWMEASNLSRWKYPTLIKHPEFYEENKKSQRDNIGLYLDYARTMQFTLLMFQCLGMTLVIG